MFLCYCFDCDEVNDRKLDQSLHFDLGVLIGFYIAFHTVLIFKCYLLSAFRFRFFFLIVSFRCIFTTPVPFYLCYSRPDIKDSKLLAKMRFFCIRVIYILSTNSY